MFPHRLLGLLGKETANLVGHATLGTNPNKKTAGTRLCTSIRLCQGHITKLNVRSMMLQVFLTSAADGRVKYKERQHRILFFFFPFKKGTSVDSLQTPGPRGENKNGGMIQ